MFESATVADALRILSDGAIPPPDWILLDLMLPDGSGIDVLRAVRAWGMNTRVCIVTGCCTDLLSEARREGAECAFTKPLDIRRLITALTTQHVGEA